MIQHAPLAPSPVRLLAAALLVFGVLAATTSEAADERRNVDAKLVLHLIPDSGERRLSCFNHGVGAVEDVVAHGEIGEDGEPARYLAYLMVTDFEADVGVTAIQFGIVYDPEEGSGVDVERWQDCALLEFHAEDWPQAGSGNLLTWNQVNDCQNDGPVVVGFFRLAVYSDDQFKIIPRPVDNKAVIVGCGLTPLNYDELQVDLKIENLGHVGFGAKEGYNPWNPEENPLEMKKRFKPIRD